MLRLSVEEAQLLGFHEPDTATLEEIENALANRFPCREMGPTPDGGCCCSDEPLYCGLYREHRGDCAALLTDRFGVEYVVTWRRTS